MQQANHIPLFLAISLLLGVLIACGPRNASAPAGEVLFATNCATCHGADARGGAQVPDLTGLAMRAGGAYPHTRVLDKLDGYARGQTAYSGTQMPDFGHLLTGRLIRTDLPAGMSRPYPEAIVALSSWLETVQR